MGKNFAVILNNKVTNIIVAENKEIAEEVTGFTCIEYTDKSPAGIGWIWDETNFIAPIVEEEPTE